MGRPLETGPQGRGAAGNLSKAATTLYQESLPAVTADTVDKLRLLHPEDEMEYNKEFRPSLQQEDDFGKSEEELTRP